MARLSKHDRKVARVAAGYRSLGYRVKADLPGWTTPPVLNGSRPDVLATKGKKKIAVEVETPKSYGLEHSMGQRRDLREWANSKGYRRFRATRTK